MRESEIVLARTIESAIRRRPHLDRTGTAAATDSQLLPT
jgi:hypothetical protein